MASDDIVEAAKAEIRRSVWASLRGKATRAYIRDNPEIVEEFTETSTILDRQFPEHVTKASVLLELHMRARKKEASIQAKQWEDQHPEETEKIRQQVQREMEAANVTDNSKMVEGNQEVAPKQSL